MPSYHACIFEPADKLGGLADALASASHAMAIAEHPAEGKTKRIHCHIVLGGMSHNEDWIRTTIKGFFPDTKRGSYWVSSKVQKGEHKGKLIDFDSALVYIIKGKHELKFQKNISKDLVETSRQKWVEEANPDTSPKDEPAAKSYVNKVIQIQRFREILFYHDLPVGDVITNDRGFTETLTRDEQLFNDVRFETMKMFLREKHGLVPPAALYKQVSCSAFIAIMKRLDMESVAIKRVMAKWY